MSLFHHLSLNTFKLNIIYAYIVDGGWGAWGEWSECPVSCGGGQNTRARACDSPAPQHGGAECVGDATETGPCNENPCPSKWTFPLIFSHGAAFLQI